MLMGDPGILTPGIAILTAEACAEAAGAVNIEINEFKSR
jgi:hypothetical protein